MRQIYCVFSDAGKSVKVFFLQMCQLFMRHPVHYSCAILYIIRAPPCTLFVRHSVLYPCATRYIIRAPLCTLFVLYPVHYSCTTLYIIH